MNCLRYHRPTPLLVMKVNFVGLRPHRAGPPVDAGRVGSGTHWPRWPGQGWAAHTAEIDELLATDGFDAGVAWCEEKLATFEDPYFFSKECVIRYTHTRSRPAIRQGVRMNCLSPSRWTRR